MMETVVIGKPDEPGGPAADVRIITARKMTMMSAN